jgi:4a-hydroxytetrahydrobiopterin dehydratase
MSEMSNDTPAIDVEKALSRLEGWELTPEGAIARSFKFADFTQAFAFMTRVAFLAEKANHHPDWSNSYNRVDIALKTHDKDAITQKDIDLATAISAL